MNRRYVVCSTLAIALSLVASTAPAAADAQAKTAELVAAFKAVQSGKGLSASQLKINGAQFRKIDQLIHHETIVSETIAPQKSKITPAELADFKAVFWATLRNVAYASSGEFFRKAKIKIGATQLKVAGHDVVVHAELSDEDLETDITFHWRTIAGKLRLVDVSFDGASLVLDYKNQFGRIVAKKGSAGLIQLLRDKYKESIATPLTDEKSVL